MTVNGQPGTQHPVQQEMSIIYTFHGAFQSLQGNATTVDQDMPTSKPYLLRHS